MVCWILLAQVIQLLFLNISVILQNRQFYHFLYSFNSYRAGVLYMFSDANKKLPAMAVAISECKCARRVVSSQRPHCFEIMLKTSVLQLAAPDEYVASEWLQAVVQSASGLFEHQERHKTLGCTLVITTNHLITLREDFSSPLRRLNSKGAIEPSVLPKPQHSESFTLDRKMSISTMSDSTMNDVSWA